MSAKVVVIDSVRTPWCKPNGGMASLISSDLARAALLGLLERTGLEARQAEQTVFGQGHPSTYPNNIGHFAALCAGFPEETPGYTVHSNCACGLQALRSAFYLIASGSAHCCIAGGADSYSAAPLVIRNARTRFAPADRVVIDTVEEAERSTQPAAITRLAHYRSAYGGSSAAAEAFARASRENALAFVREHAAQIVPVRYTDRKKGEVCIQRDEWPDFPAFSDLAPYADGAAASLLMSQERARALGLHPAAVILGFAVAGCAPDQRQRAGALAAQKLLGRHGLSIGDIDCVEILENSAQDVLFALDLLGAGGQDLPAVNACGGALSFGKNDGADGIAMLISATASLKADELGLLCIGGAGGQGMAALIKKCNSKEGE